MATTRIDLAHDPSKVPKDMSIRLELDAEEDWEDDLEEFCRLRRLGLFNEAREQFRTTLEHVSANNPYIRVQYAEMLLSCGDYKGFQDFVFIPDFLPHPSEETSEDRNRGKLVANYALLDLLSQRPIPNFLTAAWGVVRHTLRALATETTMGSTEVRRTALSTRMPPAMSRLTLSLPDPITVSVPPCPPPSRELHTRSCCRRSKTLYTPPF
jgi:hypothetical protein